MGARVFISCGQTTPAETAVANRVAEWFRSEGYVPYVAVTVQTIRELNTGIIGALRNTDYYLFINFRREEVISTPNFFRGSLYTQQELAVAYALDIERMILVNQTRTAKEGVLKYIVSNTPEFETGDEVLDIVKNAVQVERWSPSYSRQLEVTQVMFEFPPSWFRDHTTVQPRHSLFLQGFVLNRRPDIAARQVICRLRSVTTIRGQLVVHTDLTRLKATGFSGYEQTIWPLSMARFDLLSVHVSNPTEIYLHSERDMYPRLPAFSAVGRYKLVYEILAEHFPHLEFAVELAVTGDVNTTTASLTTV